MTPSEPWPEYTSSMPGLLGRCSKAPLKISRAADPVALGEVAHGVKWETARKVVQAADERQLPRSGRHPHGAHLHGAALAKDDDIGDEKKDTGTRRSIGSQSAPY
jgi:hypothetical protein